MLALAYGEPSYWMNPELPDELIATALQVAARKGKQ